MSDTTTEPVKKPIWTRCKGPDGKGNGCGQRVFNDRIDIEKHRQHCPADLEREVKRLKGLIEPLVERVEKLEKADVPELPDLDDVADDWPAADPSDDQHSTYVDDDLDFPTETTRANATAAFTTPASDLDDDSDDDYFEHPARTVP